MDARRQDTMRSLPAEPTMDGIPNEAVTKILKKCLESLPKPAIQFAGFHYETCENGADDAQGAAARSRFQMSLTPWSDGDLISGYVAPFILSTTCKRWHAILGGIFRRALQPSIIPYRNAPKPWNSTADMLCLVPIAISQNVLWDCEQHLRARRVGVRVDTTMWHDLLTFLFHGEGKECNFDTLYQSWWGQLDILNLAQAMSCFELSGLEAFDFVLTDVTRPDWESYYSNFPTAFYDGHGSPYVEVKERPLHSTTFSHVWNSYPWQAPSEDYPYADGDRPLADSHRGRRVDGLMRPRQRVSLLLAFLRAAECHSHRQYSSLPKLRLRVVVRKPAAAPDIQGEGAGEVPLSEAEQADELIMVQSTPVDLETVMIQEALERLDEDSTLLYECSPQVDSEDEA
ncbi:hypothetical protein CONLIGDRAFT_708543 [Coniochaeta ligniaria NRRL 30616]|uniref:Uncharacterized protein n=1 Tax=Coniochaeta ligniaria NRRL 30616 TaxID=1408157 RepID=A0A1J7IDL0_9PEZI|nr:hypothetical protein CONLIGDRAFT_708543 [Coniochaeta ligniaria NRRL 30616]